MELELEALTQLRGAIGHCEKVKDYVSRDLFSDILENEESTRTSIRARPRLRRWASCDRSSVSTAR